MFSVIPPDTPGNDTNYWLVVSANEWMRFLNHLIARPHIVGKYTEMENAGRHATTLNDLIIGETR